jgi:hypothetical protein
VRHQEEGRDGGRVHEKLSVVDPRAESRERAPHGAGPHRRADRHAGQVAGLRLAVAVVDGDLGELLPDAHDLGVERLARRAGVTKRLEPPRLTALRDGPVLGGGHAEHVHALPFQHVESLVRVEACIVQQRRGAPQPGGNERVAGGERPAARRGAPAEVSGAGVVPVLGLHALPREVGVSVPDRLRLARGARREHDQGRLLRRDIRRPHGIVVEERVVGHRKDRPVEPGGRNQLQVAGVGDDRARLDALHARPEVRGAELLGARERHRAEAPARDHRVGPLGPVAHHRHHHVPA